MLPASSPSAVTIAEELQGRIHRGELGPGDRLPAERDLADQLQVSRVRVREAFGILETGGYLTVKRGATGGRFVTELKGPQRRWINQMRKNLSDLDQLLDLRLALERQTAIFAAARREEADLLALRRAIAQLESSDTPHTYRLADTAFHAAVSAAARSQRLAEGVERVRGELFAPIDELWLDQRAGDSAADHRRVLEAITAGDGDRAAAAMVGHIESTRQEIHDLLT